MDESLAAVVLAAGAGTRLRPLTLVRPKPLCPVANVPLVDHAVARAETAVRAVAVNIHHGRDAMEAHLAGRVHLSYEAEQALGTAGALAFLRDWLDGRDALVLNADTFCTAPLDGFVGGWDRERVRVQVAGDDELQPSSLVAAALMPWREIECLEPEPTGLYEASWRAALAAGRLDAVRLDDTCIDCGTAARYLEANLTMSGGESVIGAGAVVEGDVVRSVVWPGAIVRERERLVDGVRAGDRLTVLVR